MTGDQSRQSPGLVGAPPRWSREFADAWSGPTLRPDPAWTYDRHWGETTAASALPSASSLHPHRSCTRRWPEKENKYFFKILSLQRQHGDKSAKSHDIMIGSETGTINRFSKIWNNVLIENKCFPLPPVMIKKSRSSKAHREPMWLYLKVGLCAAAFYGLPAVRWSRRMEARWLDRFVGQVVKELLLLSQEGVLLHFELITRAGSAGVLRANIVTNLWGCDKTRATGRGQSET